MIKELISHQEEQLSETQCSDQLIPSILQSIKSKKELITAILLLEDRERALLLFILQDDPCSSYELKGHSFSSLSISEYLGEGKDFQGTLKLYTLSPIFFKALLVLAQKKPNVFAGSDLINIENLLDRLETCEQDAVLSLKKGDETSLFYFMEGKLSEGYFENESGLAEESNLRDKLLIYTYSANEEEPVELSLYYDLEVGPFDDIEDPSSESNGSPADPPAKHPLLILKRDAVRTFKGRKNKSSIIKGNNLLEANKRTEMILDKEIFTLGRDHENDWTINDPASSRVHAIIKSCPDGYYIEDRESRNGTFVNKQRIDRHKLSDQDKIQIGLYQFVFSAAGNKEKRVVSPSSLVQDNNENSDSIVKNRQNLPMEKPSPQNWGLEVISENMAGDFFEFSGELLSLGRGDTDIQVKDPQVSRHHANIEWTDEGFVLSDCKSANGIFVNDELITTKQLLIDDVIKVGDTQFRVVCKE